MTKFLKNLLLLLVMSVVGYADERFTAYSYTGTQVLGSVVDVRVGNSMLDFSLWTYWVQGTPAYTSGYAPQAMGTPGDSGATLDANSPAISWYLQSANWDTGYGWALLTSDTDFPPGIYYVGNMTCTGEAIWVILD